VLRINERFSQFLMPLTHCRDFGADLPISLVLFAFFCLAPELLPKMVLGQYLNDLNDMLLKDDTSRSTRLLDWTLVIFT